MVRVVNTETPNWSKCQKQISLIAQPWMSYHDQSPPSQVSGKTDENRVKRMGVLVAGEGSCKTLTSGRGMAVVHMTSWMSSRGSGGWICYIYIGQMYENLKE